MHVVNLLGAPGAGKSTGAAYVFSGLKMAGVNVEYVGEFAKELVWESRAETFKDEVYIFAKQNHRLFRLRDKVDVVVTDRPLLLTKVYNRLYGFNSDALDALVDAEYERYININYLIVRAKPYAEVGRNQKQPEADMIHGKIREMLDGHHAYTWVSGNAAGYNAIISDVMSILRGES